MVYNVSEIQTVISLWVIKMLPKKCDPAHISVTVSMESGYLYPTILPAIFFQNHEHIRICSLWTEVVVY